MTATELAPRLTRMPGEIARDIITAYRGEVQDYSRVEELEREFPTYARLLGSDAIFLMNAADNLAGAFKWRGAFVGAHALKEAGATGLITPSAGNALRGGALAAKAAGLEYHGVVPITAPLQKREGARALYDDPRFQLHVVGSSFDEALEWALEHPELGKLLHPFNDPNVIAGQGTVADDILESALGRDIRHIVAPTGGSGLVAGVLQRLAELSRTDITVHAAEAAGSNSLSLSLRAGRVVDAEAPNARYGGSAVRRIGDYTLSVCRDADNLRTLTVSDDEVDMLTESYEQDRYDLWRQDTPNFEPTTLVAVAALKQLVAKHPGEPMVVIGTGYNDSLWPSLPTPRTTNIIR
ncbi:MAG TPA: pyridoxal-phosphate dependent enzyme [Candidatus Saccharimonadales bacterium]